jgi:transcriptional regulator with XRE-family HTH domain
MAPGRDNGDQSALAMFAAELRAARAKAGLSRDELAALVNYSGSLIGMIETLARAPSLKLAQCLDSALGTPGTFERMQQHLRAAPFPGWFAQWPDKEAEATVLRSFELVVVPGLLQTEDYARVVLRTRVKATDDEIEEMVAARMKRQAVLARENPPMLWVIIAEGVLRCPVGGSKIMYEQLAHLGGMARRPNIVVQVVPLGVGAHEGFRGPFTIADFAASPAVAYQDTAVRGQVIEDSEDLMSLAVLWETLKAEALPRGASLDLIGEVAQTWT